MFRGSGIRSGRGHRPGMRPSRLRGRGLSSEVRKRLQQLDRGGADPCAVHQVSVAGAAASWRVNPLPPPRCGGCELASPERDASRARRASVATRTVRGRLARGHRTIRLRARAAAAESTPTRRRCAQGSAGRRPRPRGARGSVSSGASRGAHNLRCAAHAAALRATLPGRKWRRGRGGSAPLPDRCARRSAPADRLGRRRSAGAARHSIEVREPLSPPAPLSSPAPRTRSQPLHPLPGSGQGRSNSG